MNKITANTPSSLLWSFAIGAIAGLYPLLSLYSKNLTLVNTWEHFLVFVLVAIVIPGLVTALLASLFRKKKWTQKLLAGINIFFFITWVSVSVLAGFVLKWILAAVLLGMVLGFFLGNYLKKVLIMELILAVIAFVVLIPRLYQIISHTDDWKSLPDTIADVSFVRKPNIYVIQPDGYVNAAELKRGYYQMDNSDFEQFLHSNGFNIYEHFRSNYDATLSSNSSLFAMKHHYYQGDASNFEVLNARKNIVSENPVLSIFKNNGYTSFLVTESPYLLLNRPSLGFDYSNFSYDEIPYLSKGLQTKKEVLPGITEFIDFETNTPKFFFVQILNPKHINGNTKGENLAQKKRQRYINNVTDTNTLLVEVIETITNKDKNALIVLLSDHGGYVGMDYLQQGNEYTDDAEKSISIFSSFLAVRWPQGAKPSYDDKFKSNVNFFRILFSHLSDQTKYLDHLEEDASFININSKAPAGVYKIIDSNGNVIFEPR